MPGSSYLLLVFVCKDKVFQCKQNIYKEDLECGIVILTSSVDYLCFAEPIDHCEGSFQKEMKIVMSFKTLSTLLGSYQPR